MDTDSFLSEALQRNERWIALADTKAGAILVAVPALTALFGVPLAQHVRKSIDVAFDAPNYWALVGAVVYVALAGLAAVAGLESLYHAYRALSPTLEPTAAMTGVIFFKHVAGRELAEWERTIEQLDGAKLQRDYVHQVYETSRICSEKFEQVANAMRLAIVFIMLAIGAYLPTAFW